MLWTIIKIILPTCIGIIIDIFLDERTAIYVGGLLTIVLAIKEYFDNISEKRNINRKFKIQEAVFSHLKKIFHKHESQPHALATAVIETKDTVAIKNSQGVSSVTDCAINEMRVHIDNPDKLRLIPNVNTDAEEHVIVTTDSSGTSSVLIKWDKTSPKVIYLTVMAGVNI